MKLDRVVLKRFQELEKKAEDVEATTRPSMSERNSLVIEHQLFEEWVASVLSLLQRIFGEDSAHYKLFYQQYTKCAGWKYGFDLCKGIFRAAKEDYEGGYLFNLKALVSAEVLSDALEQAEELLKSGYKDAACVIAGIALETAIKQICTREGIAHGKLDKMNADLCKAGLYNAGMQKQVTAWADRRNNAAHGNWTAYTAADVEDMIRGVNRFIADYLLLMRKNAV